MVCVDLVPAPVDHPLAFPKVLLELRAEAAAVAAANLEAAADRRRLVPRLYLLSRYLAAALATAIPIVPVSILRVWVSMTTHRRRRTPANRRYYCRCFVRSVLLMRVTFYAQIICLSIVKYLFDCYR